MDQFGTGLGQRQIVTIGQFDTVTMAAMVMSEHKIGCLVVTGDMGKLVGIVTERDIMSKVVAAGAPAEQTLVNDVMSRQVISAGPATGIAEAQQLMARHNIRHLPIVEHGRCVGMISSRDIVNRQLQAARAVARRQGMLIHQLEQEHPGITQVQLDPAGRVAI